MTTTYLSNQITQLDNVGGSLLYQGAPYTTTGEGGPSRSVTLVDYVSLPSAFGGTVFNLAKLCRFPSDAVIQNLEIWSDGPLDSNAATTLSLYWGVMFSDSPSDGTPVAYQGTIPTQVGIPAFINPNSPVAGTVIASPSVGGSNNIFGTLYPANNSKLGSGLEQGTGAVIYGNGIVNQYFGGPNQTPSQYLPWLTFTPIVTLFNILDGRGAPMENLGFMDVYVYVRSVAATAIAANLYCRLTYSV